MSTSAVKLKGYIKYPCHPKEKVMVYVSSHGEISCKCPRCDRIWIINSDFMTAIPGKPLKGAVSKQNNRIYRLSH